MTSRRAHCSKPRLAHFDRSFQVDGVQRYIPALAEADTVGMARTVGTDIGGTVGKTGRYMKEGADYLQ